MEHYSRRSLAKSPFRQILTDQYTGRTVEIAAASDAFLQKKVAHQLAAWEKENQIRMSRAECERLNSEAEKCYASLSSFGKRKGTFSAEKLYASLMQVYAPRPFVSQLAEPVFIKPVTVRTAKRPNRFLDFVIPGRKARRLAAEADDRLVSQRNMVAAQEEYERRLVTYQEDKRTEVERYELEEQQIKADIAAANEMLCRRKDAFMADDPDEIRFVIGQYFELVYYSPVLRDEMQRVTWNYDSCIRQIIVKRTFDLVKALPEFWKFEFKTLKSGIRRKRWTNVERAKNHEMIVRSIMARTISDLFRILSESQLDQIIYKGELASEDNPTKLVSYWAIRRSEAVSVYAKALKRLDMHGLEDIVSISTCEDILNDIDPALLLDIIRDDDSEIVLPSRSADVVLDADPPSSSLTDRERNVHEGLFELSQITQKGCRPFEKTISSFMRGYTGSVFYDVFKNMRHFGCCRDMTFAEVMDIISSLVLKKMVRRQQSGDKYLYYPIRPSDHETELDE